ncbi:MAG: PfkB family carbohydrate kinase [Prevotella sp.]|jgi:fructokinase
MGETVLDILFRGSQPIGANAGGSALNSAVSLGRAGAKVEFVGEAGADSTGVHIAQALELNHVGTGYFRLLKGMRTTTSLAYLDEENDAHYVFYMDVPKNDIPRRIPDFHPNDILLFGSFYAVNPQNQQWVDSLVEQARRQGVIIYYDINLRSPHANMLPRLMPNIRKNLGRADVVRASNGDLKTVFGSGNADSIYHAVIAPLCRNFIVTHGAHPVRVYGNGGRQYTFDVKPITTVSTIGAGDNYNAGFVYGLVRQKITREILGKPLSESQWAQLNDYAQQFSQDCCMHLDNYISNEKAAQLRDHQ